MDAILKFYSGATEYGTSGSPISFSGVVGGSGYEFALNPLYLWNDKGGSSGSVPAREITAQVLNMWIQDEALGTSDGSPSQTFTASVIPIIDDEDMTINSILKVGTNVWTRVVSLAAYGPDALIYTLDITTGIVIFGDGAFGAIPPNGQAITITYMPDLLVYGDEIYSDTWLEIKSFGCTSNVIAIVDETQLSSDVNTVIIANPQVTTVTGVWLATDPTHAGTNYYTGGSVVALTGIITLGTPLPNANTNILINYSCKPIDDLEGVYTPIGYDATHLFVNILQKNNAKLIYLKLNVPVDATPSGGGQVNFRLRLSYKQ